MTATDDVLRNQARGITGALIVSGSVVLFTVEMWWLAWQRPVSHLLAYTTVGLGVVLFVTRSSGFRVEEEGESGDGEGDERTDDGSGTRSSGGDQSKYDPRRLVVSFAQLVLQSVAAALLVLFVYGIIDRSTPAHVVGRMVLIQVVPLGFGAALSNRLLAASKEHAESVESHSLPGNLAVFAAGAIFFALPLAPSVEMNILATSTGWRRLAALVVLSLVTTYLILYELEFRGQSARRLGRDRAVLIHASQVCIVYAVGVVVSALLLWGFDNLTYVLAVDVQKVLVLAFPTTVGAAAAEVVL